MVKSSSNKQEIFNFAELIEDKVEDPIVEMKVNQYGRYFYLEDFI